MVPGTGDAAVVQVAFCQRCSLVRAKVIHRKVLSLVQKNSNDKTADKRSLCVQLMNNILTCWHDCTGGSKADLAHQTGLWKVYVDRNGWERTQTLDKYLEQATIPENPRYKTVIQTAEYVILHCENSPHLNDIEHSLSELKNMA